MNPRAAGPALLLCVLACGGGDAPAPGPVAPASPSVVPAAVRVAPDSATLLSLGDTLTLRATVTDASGRILTTATPTWRSASPTIASVSAGGTVTALANGEALIEASVGTLTAAARVLVAQRPSSVTLLRDTLPLIIGRSRPLVATVRDARGQSIAGASLRWRSAAPSVLAVDSTGVVTGVAIGGPGYVIASSGSVSDSLALRVRSVPAATVTIGLTRSDFNIGDTLRLAAVIRDSAGTVLADARPSWSVEQPLVARVDSTGRLVAVGTGRTRVVATIPGDGVRAEAAVVVRGLIHRWRFDETGGAGTVFQDDIRGAPARLVDGGPNEGVSAGGMVTLAGGPRHLSDYVALPSGLVRGGSSATIEVWATMHSVRNWSRVFDIGASQENNLFIAWSQGTERGSDRVGFSVRGVENRLDNVMAPYVLNLQHHIVMSLSERSGGGTHVTMYLDGTRRGSFSTDHRLSQLIDDNFWLGRSHYGDETANASYDEVRIHDRVYADHEIKAWFDAGPVRSGPTSLDIVLPDGVADTVRGVGSILQLRVAGTDNLGRRFPIAHATWRSLNASTATIDSAGRVTTRAPGSAEILATVGDRSARVRLEVVSQRSIRIDPFLASPAANAIWEVPVIVLAYLPTADGVMIDVRKNPGFWGLEPISLDSVEQRILDFTRRRKMMVEEGSRFRGYRDRAARPSLGYRVIDYRIIYEHPPASDRHRLYEPRGSVRFNDWQKIFSEQQLAPLINSRGVREVWFAVSGFGPGTPSYDPAFHDSLDMRTTPESNMSSPTTGDISNSHRIPDDLPILNHTYIVYLIDWRRTQAEAVHNVGHQLEQMFGEVSIRQQGNPDAFWKDFVGFTGPDRFMRGRAGWTHMPPNTNVPYDYLNRTPFFSDIETWQPSGGPTTPVSADTWAALEYPWPGGVQPPQKIESQWYIYWMQNMPGAGNRIPARSGWMTNWWAFVADWDGSIRSGLGLYGNVSSATNSEVIGPASSIRANDPKSAERAHDRWPVRETRRPPR